MISRHCFGATIITVHPSFGVLKFWWHWLSFYQLPQPKKLSFHIEHAPATYRTFIGSLYVHAIATFVNCVATWHKNHGLWGCEHVITAYRAIAIRGALDTPMSIPDRNSHACRAGLNTLSVKSEG